MYRVRVSETMSGALVEDVTRYVTSGSWFNGLNGDGSVTLNLSGLDCADNDRLKLIRGGVHELEVFRGPDSVCSALVSGRPRSCNGTMTITGVGLTYWAALRKVRIDLAAKAGLKADEFLRRMWTSALNGRGQDDPRLLEFMNFLPCSTVIENEEILATKHRLLSEVLRSVHGTVVDYSQQGRRITYFPYNSSLGYIGHVPDSMVMSDYTTDRPLSGFYTSMTVRSGTGQDEVYTTSISNNPWNILIEGRSDANSNATGVADAKVFDDVPIKTALGQGSPFTLHPDFPYPLHRIEAGMHFDLNLTSECTDISIPVRITRVGATWQASGNVNGRWAEAAENFQVAIEQWSGTDIAGHAGTPRTVSLG